MGQFSVESYPVSYFFFYFLVGQDHTLVWHFVLDSIQSWPNKKIKKKKRNRKLVAIPLFFIFVGDCGFLFLSLSFPLPVCTGHSNLRFPLTLACAQEGKREEIKDSTRSVLLFPLWLRTQQLLTIKWWP